MRVHVDDVVARFEENCMCYFCTRVIVVMVACTEIRYFIDAGGERTVRDRNASPAE